MFLLKGVIIGMFVSFPVGPLGLLSIQRSINKGWKIGFFSAVGAVTADLVYSSLAILGISFINNFVNIHKYFINGVTGILFLIVGINILSSGIERIKLKEDTEEEKIHPFFVHFLMGLSNPMTFLIFFAIFTKIGIYVDHGTTLQHMIFVISIFLGSSIIWLITTNLIEKYKKTYKFEYFNFIDKIIGTVIIIFGIFSILKGIIRF
ncbi:LysE family transporter [Clostridium sp.]|uniref:LysE family translocator n=1 Tax=Clostridium sp. TaxID=1506 RepID=UPI001A475F26|nr:LysE family transporter [Clostridium sp.]MBK5241346.1 LysE family transporter [Clostridium sp.]